MLSDRGRINGSAYCISDTLFSLRWKTTGSERLAEKWKIYGRYKVLMLSRFLNYAALA